MNEIVRMALDKSVRRIDGDGHLHVAMTNISKANVCPYRGNEIPDAERLGLDPLKVYRLLRHPDELAKAAPTFAGKPLLSLHRPTTAEDHARHATVGSIGNGVVYQHPYLRAPLVVWDGASIHGIESGEQRELSSGYRYDADMTPGRYEGADYDGVMRNIRGNHVALVESGRAGSDVVVGDAAFIPSHQEIIVMAKRPPLVPMSRKALLASGALMAYVQPKLAQDQRIDLAPLLRGVTAKNWQAQKPKIKVALDAALAGKLAADASLEDVIAMLDQLDAVVDAVPDLPPDPMQTTGAPVDPTPDAEDAPDETVEKVKAFLDGKISDEDMAELMALISGPAAAAEPEPDFVPGEDEAPNPKKEAAVGKPITQTAMDAALARVAKATETATIKRMNDIREAERTVRPYIGQIDVIAQDSAEDIYKLALDEAGIDLTDVPPAAYKAILKALPTKAATATLLVAGAPRLAHDAAAAKSLAERFPHANRLSK